MTRMTISQGKIPNDELIQSQNLGLSSDTYSSACTEMIVMLPQ